MDDVDATRGVGPDPVTLASDHDSSQVTSDPRRFPSNYGDAVAEDTRHSRDLHLPPGRTIADTDGPAPVNLLYTPTREILYWDKATSTMRIGGLAGHSNTWFYPIEQHRSPTWIEFCFKSGAIYNTTIGVRRLDLSFMLCQTPEEKALCQTVFRVGSKDGDYVAFEIPSQSGASDPETYYWTNSNSTIGFVTEYDAKLATVFKIIPVQL